MTNKQASQELFNILPRDQIDRVLGQDMVDITPDFLGFIEIYKNLSEIIPKHFVVIDFGCSYNAQSFLFIGHKKFIGVDNFPNQKRFLAPGTYFHETSIEEYISNNIDKYDLNETFAICSYVPPWGGDNMELVRRNFKNVFTFYPNSLCPHIKNHHRKNVGHLP